MGIFPLVLVKLLVIFEYFFKESLGFKTLEITWYLLESNAFAFNSNEYRCNYFDSYFWTVIGPLCYFYLAFILFSNFIDNCEHKVYRFCWFKSRQNWCGETTGDTI